jgi:tRNA(Ile)-lysidine synthase
VRPLLDFTRSETLKICQEFELPIWEDIVNQNRKYARNRIRLDLIPYLQDNFNPEVENNLAQTAEILKAEVEYLENQAEELLKQVTTEQGLNRLLLRQVPLALQRRVIRKFLGKYLKRAVKFREIEAVINLISAPNKTRTSSFSGKIVAEVNQDEIILVNLLD